MKKDGKIERQMGEWMMNIMVTGQLSGLGAGRDGWMDGHRDGCWGIEIKAE